MVDNKKIEMSDLMGKPYAENGRGPGSYDCNGLFCEIARRLGRYLPQYDTPETDDEKNELFVTVRELHFVRINTPEEWCAVIFRLWDDEGKEKWHIGHVLPGCMKFIHITEKTSVCTTSLKHKLWDLFFEGFYRYG